MSTSTDTNTERYENTAEVCCHQVKYFYDLEDYELTDELRERLDEEAESRAKALISDGCWSGDLCCLAPGGDGALYGWWDIRGK